MQLANCLKKTLYRARCDCVVPSAIEDEDEKIANSDLFCRKRSALLVGGFETLLYLYTHETLYLLYLDISYNTPTYHLISWGRWGKTDLLRNVAK